MKHLWLTYFVAWALCSGCATNRKTVERITPLNWDRAAENNQAAAIATAETAASVQAAQTVLETAVLPVPDRPVAEIPTNALHRASAELTNARSAVQVTANLLGRNQSLLGEPATNQAPRVAALLSTNPVVQSSARAIEERKAQAEGAQVAAVQKAEAKLIDLGKAAETQKAKSAWRKAWAWSVGTFGVAGTIALCVFFPAFIPIIGQLIGWIVGMIPQLASFIGLVSVKAYQRSVEAIQMIKVKAAAKGDTATLDTVRQTTAENTSPDARLVGYVKAKAGWTKSETTPSEQSEVTV